MDKGTVGANGYHQPEQSWVKSEHVLDECMVTTRVPRGA